MVGCAINGCISKPKNKSQLNEGIDQVTFHVFPECLKCKNQWIEAVKHYDENWQYTDESRLCSVHFTEDCFDRTSSFLTHLKDNAIPTIFPSHTSHLQQEIRSKGGSWCAASNCRNNYVQNKGLSFFRFPKDEKIRKIWIQNCKRNDLLSKDADYCYQNCRLCSLHFEDIMFRNQYHTRLLPRAFPTLFNNTQKNPYIIQPVKIIKLLNEDSNQGNLHEENVQEENFINLTTDEDSKVYKINDAENSLETHTIIQLPGDVQNQCDDDYLLVEIKDKQIENKQNNNPMRKKRKIPVVKEEPLINDENVRKRMKPSILKRLIPKNIKKRTEENANIKEFSNSSGNEDKKQTDKENKESKIIILENKLITQLNTDEIKNIDGNNFINLLRENIEKINKYDINESNSESIEENDLQKKVDFIIIQHPLETTNEINTEKVLNDKQISNSKINTSPYISQIGRRISDIHYFFNSLFEVFQHNVTYKCSLDSLSLELNEDEDFNSYASIKCKNCGRSFKKLLTDPSGKLLPEVNKSIVEAALGTNLKYFTMNNLFYYMCLPTMTEDKFNDLKREINKTKCRK